MPTHLLLIGAAGFMSIAIMRVSDALLPAIARDFGATVGTVGLTVTAYMVGYGLLQIFYGPLGDRLGKLRIIAAGLGATALFTIACAATGGVTALAVLRGLSGIAAGAIVPMALAHIGDTVPYERRQTTIGAFLGATITGGIVGGSLSGLFAEFADWRVAFVALGIISLAVALPLGHIALRYPRPRAAAHGAKPAATHFDLLGMPVTRFIWGAVALEGALMLGTVPFAGAALKDRFGLDYLSIGLILGSFGVGGLAYSALVRWLVRALGERRMVVAGGACVAAGYALLALGPAWQWYVPALALIGGGFFTMHSSLMTRGTEIAPNARGTAMSGFSTSLFIGQALGTFAGSLLIDGPGYAWAFGIPAAGTLLLAIGVYRALPRFQRAKH